MIKADGFTLLELIFTVLITSFLFTIAIPGFHTFILNNQLITQANTVLGSLALARSEALKRGRRVTVCASSDAIHCSDSWHSGWIVFTDTDDNNIVGSADTVVRIYDALPPGSTLIGNTPVSSTITFNARGRSVAGTLFLCDRRGADHARSIVIAATGRSRIDAADRCGS